MLKVQEVRREKGLSVPKLAELSGVSRHTIQDLERRGDCPMSIGAQLAKAMEVSLDDIWEEEEADGAPAD